MNEKTLESLTELAAKLGTTAEYLWSVLLSQAPITGTINLAVTAFWVFIARYALHYVEKKTKTPPQTADNKYPSADIEGSDAFIAWLAAVAFAMTVAVAVGSNLSTTVSALVNPEYWALHQILKQG